MDEAILYSYLHVKTYAAKDSYVLYKHYVNKDKQCELL